MKHSKRSFGKSEGKSYKWLKRILAVLVVLLVCIGIIGILYATNTSSDLNNWVDTTLTNGQSRISGIKNYLFGGPIVISKGSCMYMPLGDVNASVLTNAKIAKYVYEKEYVKNMPEFDLKTIIEYVTDIFDYSTMVAMFGAQLANDSEKFQQAYNLHNKYENLMASTKKAVKELDCELEKKACEISPIPSTMFFLTKEKFDKHGDELFEYAKEIDPKVKTMMVYCFTVNDTKYCYPCFMTDKLMDLYVCKIPFIDSQMIYTDAKLPERDNCSGEFTDCVKSSLLQYFEDTVIGQIIEDPDNAMNIIAKGIESGEIKVTQGGSYSLEEY